MKSIPFNPVRDYAPLPFTTGIFHLAAELKAAGLPWHPHTGCFVQDPDRYVQAPSPFPERVYFILSVPRFVDLFGSIESIAEKLVWLPTWHQARLVCRSMTIDDTVTLPPAGQDLETLYRLILSHL